jgi:AmmeMemoRadiSam system protein B
VSPLLPALRGNLDFMPSPVPERPGLLLRDPFRYSDSVIIIPPALVPLLVFFDGQHAELDLRETLVQMTGDVRVGEVVRHVVDTLRQGGFLQDEVLERLKETRHREFAAAAERQPVHAGSAYPAEAPALRDTIGRYLDGVVPPPADGLIGIAAPHVSPEGGWRSYRAAYTALAPAHADRTFVVLGTSHYGEPERFGLTVKPFVTPLGTTRIDHDIVQTLAAQGGPAAAVEDYCHAVEHSIEFQVVFLQYLFGPSIRVVPILCGPFARGTTADRLPEEDPSVARFLGALAELAAREGDRLFWVLGVDMAHVGRRYGDRFAARTGSPEMDDIEQRDRRRIDCIAAGDAVGFWERVREGQDRLRWCGASPLYAFLRAVAGARGELLHYEQWNIDAESVVSFAGLAFRRAGRSR